MEHRIVALESQVATLQNELATVRKEFKAEMKFAEFVINQGSDINRWFLENKGFIIDLMINNPVGLGSSSLSVHITQGSIKFSVRIHIVGSCVGRWIGYYPCIHRIYIEGKIIWSIEEKTTSKQTERVIDNIETNWPKFVEICTKWIDKLSESPESRLEFEAHLLSSGVITIKTL